MSPSRRTRLLDMLIYTDTQLSVFDFLKWPNNLPFELLASHPLKPDAGGRRHQNGQPMDSTLSLGSNRWRDLRSPTDPSLSSSVPSSTPTGFSFFPRTRKIFICRQTSRGLDTRLFPLLAAAEQPNPQQSTPNPRPTKPHDGIQPGTNSNGYVAATPGPLGHFQNRRD